MSALLLGAERRGPTRCITRERMRWYVDVLHSLAENDGRLHGDAEANIHSEESFAVAQGLPGIVADGPISTNWLLGLLLDVFGPGCFPGRLNTKHIRPTLEGQQVTTALRVIAVVTLPDGGSRYTVDLWCEDEAQVPLTVGSAVVTTGPAATDGSIAL